MSDTSPARAPGALSLADVVNAASEHGWRLSLSLGRISDHLAGVPPRPDESVRTTAGPIESVAYLAERLNLMATEAQAVERMLQGDGSKAVETLAGYR